MRSYIFSRIKKKPTKLDGARETNFFARFPKYILKNLSGFAEENVRKPPTSQYL
jgi:hypothetical protein